MYTNRQPIGTSRYLNSNLHRQELNCMNTSRDRSKAFALLQALLVTVLWSTSWVLIKFGLQDIPPLTFAALRYGLAFLVLLIIQLRRYPGQLRSINRKDWITLLVLGMVGYAIAQGAQFVGLNYLTAIMLSFMLTFTALITAFLGILFLGEHLNWLQWLGVGVFIIGVVLYFFPLELPQGIGIGLAIGVVNVLANCFASIIGRSINRQAHIPPLTVTVVSMGVGSITLLMIGLTTEPFPALSLANWANIVWMALMNTALAFTLWNNTLRTLTAAESSVINNTMLMQIAILAWLFLGEQPNSRQWIGMLVATIGVVMVNLPGKAQKRKTV